MKTKIALISLTLTLFIFGCKKESLQSINLFKFTSISGSKTSTTGSVTLEWKDGKNTSWKIKVINPDGTTRSSDLNWDIPQKQISNLGLDSTYTISITGTKDTTQSGSINARIGTMGDVMFDNQKP